MHREDLFISLPIEKIGLLAAAFTLPVIALNFIAIEGKINPSKGSSLLVDAMAISCIPSYFSLAVTYFLTLGYKGHILAIAIFQFDTFYIVKLIAKHES